MIAAGFVSFMIGVLLAQIAEKNDRYEIVSGCFLLTGVALGIFGIAKWLWEVAP